MFENDIPIGRPPASITRKELTIKSDGKVWCSFLIGEPGFIHVNAETELTITAQLAASDPIFRVLRVHPDIGLLAIDFSRRIRMRISSLLSNSSC